MPRSVARTDLILKTKFQTDLDGFGLKNTKQDLHKK